MKAYNIGVFELAHDGCLLDKPDRVLLRGVLVQYLHSHIEISLFCVPQRMTHSTKLTRPQVVTNPERERGKEIQVCTCVRVCVTHSICFLLISRYFLFASWSKRALESAAGLQYFSHSSKKAQLFALGELGVCKYVHVT